MTDSGGMFRGVLVAALAFLVAGTAPAAGQNLKLSDTITLRNGTCSLVSDATDKEQPPEPRGPQHCVFHANASGFIQITVPGNKDESIICQCTIAPNGAIKGVAREGQGPAAYSATVTGVTRPGTKPVNLLTTGAVLRVWEAPSAP